MLRSGERESRRVEHELAEPCVKGSLLLGAAVAVRRRSQRGEIGAEELAKLSPEALELVDAEIAVSRWYPMRLMQELVDLDWRAAGGDPEYQRQAGRRTANHFAKTGLYQQVEYARSNRGARTQRDVLRQSRMVCTITSTLYDFIEARSELLGKDRLQVVFENAAAFPEALRYSTEGFLDEMTQRTTRRWTSERPSPDRVVFSLEIRPRD
jgi:hypothetical protein